MTTTQLTPAQHAILAKAINSSGGKIDWFPDNIKCGARQKVLDGLINRALVTPDGDGWCVAFEGYDAMGMPRRGVSKKRIGKFEAKLDWIIANAEGPPPPAQGDAELEAAIAAAEATWAKPRTRVNSKSCGCCNGPKAQPSGRFTTPPAGRRTPCEARLLVRSRRSWA